MPSLKSNSLDLNKQDEEHFEFNKEEFLDSDQELFDYDYDEQEDPRDYCTGGYHPVQIGDLLCNNRYQITHKLGWGASATVWKCWDHQRIQFVALKITKSSSRYTKLALDEINILKRIEMSNAENNPHKDKIIQLLNQFSISGVNGIHICVVFELVDYDLLQLIQISKDCILLPYVKRITRQVLESLDYLHNKCKLIHTDIKLDNILVSVDEKNAEKSSLHNFRSETNLLKRSSTCPELRLHKPKLGADTEECELSIKIADFATAKSVYHNLSHYNQTRQYRCPEVILRAGFGPAVDIWCTACMVYELATGHSIFNPESGEDLTNEVLLEQIILLLGEIPKDVVSLGEMSKEYLTEDGKLRYVSKWKSRGLLQRLIEGFKWVESEAREFVDFLMPMLAIDPRKRATAKDCITHPWLYK